MIPAPAPRRGEAGPAEQKGWGWEESRASFLAKLLTEDVSEDSDSGREPVQRGLSLKLAPFAT